MSHAVTQTLEVFSKHEATDNEQGVVANPVSPEQRRGQLEVRTQPGLHRQFQPAGVTQN